MQQENEETDATSQTRASLDALVAAVRSFVVHSLQIEYVDEDFTRRYHHLSRLLLARVLDAAFAMADTWSNASISDLDSASTSAAGKLAEYVRSFPRREPFVFYFSVDRGATVPEVDYSCSVYSEEFADILNLATALSVTLDRDPVAATLRYVAPASPAWSRATESGAWLRVGWINDASLLGVLTSPARSHS